MIDKAPFITVTSAPAVAADLKTWLDIFRSIPRQKIDINTLQYMKLQPAASQIGLALNHRFI